MVIQPDKGLVLPEPPTEAEKHSYLFRNLSLLIPASLVSVGTLVISQVHFLSVRVWLLVFSPFLLFMVIYFLISLRVNATRHSFDFEAHQRLVAAWRPRAYPSVDVLLPICNEALPVLNNTWSHVRQLAMTYRGDVAVYVLDDGNDVRARTLAERYGFHYTVRENRGHLKKAGNLRHGYQISSNDVLVIFDADFAPRDDFLDELLPHMDADPDLGIVQSPQYFRVDPRQNWVERGAGAVQEYFYRVVQTSRDSLNGAICVGSCAVYRRIALDAIGGTALIEHSEDVHTGFDLGQIGWRLRYVPLPLATGMCPRDADSFLTQQYRWCMGSMSLLLSRKFWHANLSRAARLCYFSGFCYYISTALFSVVAPLIPIVLILALPGEVHPRNFLWIIPSTLFSLVIFPLWHEARYGPAALSAKHLYGWAHAFALLDKLRGRPRGWQATGAGRKLGVDRIWATITVWGGLTSAVWVGGSIARMLEYGPFAFAFLLVTGLIYGAIVCAAVMSRRDRAVAVPVLAQ